MKRMIFSNLIIVMGLITGALGEQTHKSSGFCYCAIFFAGDDPGKDGPLLVSDPDIPVPHNTNGAKTCLRICTVLFEATRMNAIKTLCQVLKKDIFNQKVKIYFRICGEEKWVSIRKVINKPVCCKDRDPIDCPEE